MYFSRCSSFYQPKKETAAIKCNKIFRPWDSSDKIQEDSSRNSDYDNCPQDATISTTTENEDSGINVKDINESENEASLKECKPFSARYEESIKTAFDYPLNLERYPLYPDYTHTNLAHSLGLTPSDPLFLEYVSQGCTLEEYTRVMNQEHQNKLLNARKQRPKKYRCPHCDVGFSNNGQLKGHIRIHTGERPFRCDEASCGKTFTRNEELTRHKRIHSGLRPFPCTHCGKRFGRKDHLKKHCRTHFQPRGLYAVPVMMPYEAWTSSTSSYPFVPMFTY